MEKSILDVIHLFDATAHQMENLKGGCSPAFSLTYGKANRWDDGPPKVSLSCSFYDGTDYQTVRAANLDRLTAECLRRCGFAERETEATAAVERSLVALPAPTDGEEIQF